MNAVQDLERSIVDARDRGDTATLQRLQARYRTLASPIRVSGPAAIRLVERSESPVIADSARERVGTTVESVLLRAEARLAMRNAGLDVEREAGGWLVGWEDPDSRTLVVETAYAAKGSNFTGETRDTLRLDGEWMGVIDAKAQRCRWKILGDWHSHPEPSGPSGRDEHGWCGQAKGLRQPYVGLLVCPHEADMLEDTDRFRRPQWTAWIASPDGRLRPVPLTFELSREGE